MESNLYLKHSTIRLTPLCNLKCRLCAAYIPYNNEKNHYSIAVLKENTERYFNIVDHIEKFTVSGGEPFLSPYLNEYLEFLYDNYSDKLDLIEIITNGTLVPPDSTVKTMKRFDHKIEVLIDNYGEHISKKVDEISDVLTANNISHKIRDYYSENTHCGGWVDFGDVSVLKHSRDEAAELYSKCAYPAKIHFCFTILDHIVYPCPPIGHRYELGLPLDQDEYIDLSDDSLSSEANREKIRNILNLKMLSGCLYCNGMCDGSTRFKPAEQLTKAEIEQIRMKKK